MKKYSATTIIRASPDVVWQTTFHTEEIFSGLLLPIFGRSLPDLTENFQGFAAALKVQAENSVATLPGSPAH